jgi:hypothetical protein
MPRYVIRATALALAMAAPAFAAETPTKAQVMEAIGVFEADTAGSLTTPKSADEANAAVARASNTILKFALESDLVVVDLGTDSVPWCDVKKGLSELSNSGERGLLLAAYLSGSVKAQLRSGKQDANPYPGWLAMLRVYHTLRVREGLRIPEVEALLVRQADGSLESYAADALRRSNESLQRTYGRAGAPPKQIVTADSRP